MNIWLKKHDEINNIFNTISVAHLFLHLQSEVNSFAATRDHGKLLHMLFKEKKLKRIMQTLIKIIPNPYRCLQRPFDA